MRKLLSIVSIALLTFCAVGCSSSFDEPNESNQSFDREGSTYSLNTLSTAYQTAKTMSSLSLSEEMIQEVHDAVTKSLEYGLDESIFLAELFSPDKILSKGAPMKIGNVLKTQLMLSKSRALSEEQIEKDGLQIYWPYSENWDGKTRPYITFMPQDPDQNWNYGYRKNGNTIDSIRLDEEVAKRIPVWVINYAEISHKDIPEFTNGKSVKNNNYFCPRAKGSSAPNKVSLDRTEPTPLVFTLLLGKFSSHHQYDSWLAGGSEFKISMGIPTFEKDASGEYQRGADAINFATVILTRKEIDEKKEVDVNAILCADWGPMIDNAAFSIIEEDGGDDQKIPFELSATIKGVKLAVNLDLGAHLQDEKIYNVVYTRRFIRSTNNSGWLSSGYPGVHWTLPIQKGFVASDDVINN